MRSQFNSNVTCSSPRTKYGDFAYTMIVLKLPLFITIALLLVGKETTSAKLNKRNVLGDKKAKLLLHGVSVHPSGTRHLHGHRALQDACVAELTAAVDCVYSYPSTADACATCVDDAYNKTLDNPAFTCDSLEGDMCNALKVVCSPSCDACFNELEAMYACVASEGGCAGFDCTTTDPPPTCDWKAFNAMCVEAMGTGTTAACVLSPIPAI